MRIILVALLFISSCATAPTTTVKPPPISRPGAANAFDSNAYDALITAQASIANARTTILASYPNLRPQLNAVMMTYNSVMKAYLAYHQLVMSGSLPDTVSVQNKINGMVSMISVLAAQIK